MSLHIRFLGTGTSQGVPLISCQCKVCTSSNDKDKRLRASVLVYNEVNTVSIDCTPDFRTQMLSAKATKLDAIVFTHEHQDHVSGLDDVRAFNYISNSAMHLYATERVHNRIKHLFDYAFGANKYPGAPDFELHTFDDQSFVVGSLEFIPIKVMHGDWPVTGFRIGDFVYITDASRIEEEEFEKIKGAKIIVVNALRKDKHHSHFNLKEAIDIINKSGAEKGYITHMSHRMGLHNDVSQEIPENVFLAYDGLELTI